MQRKPAFSADCEYQTLREELLQGKRYVFERPLIIVAVALAAFKVGEPPHLPFVAIGLIPLMLFNFWFTVNRLQSMARIVAYIQIELEEKRFGEWHGWETSLRFYRKWSKSNREQVKEIFTKETDEQAVPDALMYYPPIFYLHIAVVTLAGIPSTIYILFHPDTLGSALVGYVCSTIAACAILLYFRDCIQFRPSKMRLIIEQNRVVWRHSLEFMHQQLGDNTPETDGDEARVYPRNWLLGACLIGAGVGSIFAALKIGRYLIRGQRCAAQPPAGADGLRRRSAEHRSAP